MSTKTNELREEIIKIIGDYEPHNDGMINNVVNKILSLVQSYLKKEMPKKALFGIATEQELREYPGIGFGRQEGYNLALSEVNKVLDDLTRKE